MDADDFVIELQRALPVQCVFTDPDIIGAYSHDDAEWAPAGLAAALVRARTAEQVQIVVRLCIKHGRPIVARGSGTGLSGGANAIDGCVVLSLDKMTEIILIDVTERIAVVQPGVINDDLRTACAEHGLWYPPDPASSPWSSIGGNVATNAGGVCCVKYGVTRDYVLELQVVTGTGDLVRIGHRTAKGVAGYDLVGLMVGSEGTLGIVTEVTVRLLPLPDPGITVVGYFSSLHDAGAAVAEVTRASLVPAAFELVDKHCLAAVDAWKNMDLSVDAEVLLLARSDERGSSGEQTADGIIACFDKVGATFTARSSTAEEAEMLFSARRLAYPALERLGPVLTEDVCVPKAAIPSMLAIIETAAQQHGIKIANIAHVGDGNLHPLLITPHDDPESRSRAQAAFEDIINGALELGGTVTGEHGVGLLKRDGLARELSAPVIAMHHSVKRALDPHNIMNPGKAIPD